MFWKKKAEPDSPANRSFPARAGSLDSPRPVPILKSQPAPGSGGPSIRFARSVSDTGNGTCSSPNSGRFPAQVQMATPKQHSNQNQVQPQRSPQHVPVHAPIPRHAVPQMNMPQPYGPPRQAARIALAPQNLNLSTQSMEPSFNGCSASTSQGGPGIENGITRGSSPHPAVQRVQGARKSSRPTSPSSTSFGSRFPPPPPAALRQASPLTTPPLAPSLHVTTPPIAYVSTMQTRAPPPPSPYRPTSDRRAISPLPDHMGARPPRVSSLFETPSAPGRSPASLGVGSAGPDMTTPRAPGLPTFNFIPATPQTVGEEWFVRRSASAEGSMALQGALPLDEMVDVPLETSVSAPSHMGMSAGVAGRVLDAGSVMERAEDQEEVINLNDEGELPASGSLPEISQLEFSPFDIRVSLPSTASGSSISSLPYSNDDADPIDTIAASSANASAPLHYYPLLPPSEPLPSPPFESYSSLPSLDSEPSLRASSSQNSLISSASTSSLASYSDVEEALGSMLASLSDPSMPQIPQIPVMSKLEKTMERSDSKSSHLGSGNPGLGLGLAIPSTSSITAPLSPRRRQPPPPPLDLTLARNPALPLPDQASAPARINHRVAFYTTARAHPNSPSSGVFTHYSSSNPDFSNLITPDVQSPTRSESDSVLSLSSDDTEQSARVYNNPRNNSARNSVRDSHRRSSQHGVRDSVMSSFSMGSEASDEDLHTASIVCLTPVVGGSKGMMVGLGLAGVEVGTSPTIVGGGGREECLVETRYESEVGLAF